MLPLKGTVADQKEKQFPNYAVEGWLGSRHYVASPCVDKHIGVSCSTWLLNGYVRCKSSPAFYELKATIMQKVGEVDGHQRD